MIPLLIHQIWIQGADKLPAHLLAEVQHCRKVNSNFKHHVWSEAEILPLLASVNPRYVQMYQGYEKYAQKADLARYVILYVHGGIYLDTDMVCHKNLTPFTRHDVFFTAPPLYKIVKSIQNCIIGIEPKHPLMAVILDLCSQRQSVPSIMKSTGPKMIYDAVKIYSKTGHHVPIIARKYLYPCQPYDDDTCPYTCQDCYVAHMANASWYSNQTQSIHSYLRNNKLAFATVGVAVLSVIALGS